MCPTASVSLHSALRQIRSLYRTDNLVWRRGTEISERALPILSRTATSDQAGLINRLTSLIAASWRRQQGECRALCEFRGRPGRWNAAGQAQLPGVRPEAV